MDEDSYRRYIDRFNTCDESAFDDYFDRDIRLRNGTLEVRGREAVRRMYSATWATFTEDVRYEQFLSDGRSIAVKMRAHFTTIADNTESPLGPVSIGQTFDFEGLALYTVASGQFTDIVVAYNSFRAIDPDGSVVELKMPF